MLFRKKINPGDLLLLAANFLPVIGVWFLDWNPVQAFVIYAMETMIVGIMTVLKLLISTFAKGKDDWNNNGMVTKVSGFFFIFFFIIHFGLFALIQTTIFSETAKLSPPGSNMFHFFFKWYTYINKETGYALLAFVAGYVSSSLIPFLVNGDYKKQSMMLTMFQPYGRIFVQQFTVILGSMFLSMGLGKVFILVFILAKLAFEFLLDFDGILRKSATDLMDKAKTLKDQGKTRDNTGEDEAGR